MKTKPYVRPSSVEDRAARAGLSVGAYEKKLKYDRENRSSLKIPKEVYLDVLDVAEKTRKTLTEVTQILLDYALDHVSFTKKPVYHYELVFDGEEPDEDND